MTPDIGGNIGSAVQSHARSRGPYDGKLFVFQPTKPLPGHDQFFITANNIYQSSYGSWRMLRMVKDFMIKVNEGDRQVRRERWKGKYVPIEGFYPERTPEASFTLGEQFDPYTLQLGFGQHRSPVKASAGQIEEEWCFSMQGLKLFPLPVEFNIVSAVANGVTNVTGTPVATGGELPADTYRYCVTPVYGTSEGPYQIAAESAGIITTGSTSQVIVNWTYNTGETPDYFRIYRTNEEAGNYDPQSLVAQVPGYLRSVVDDGSPLDDGQPQLSAEPITVQDITGLKTYSGTTDYLFDPVNGTIRRRESSLIGDGQMVRCSYLAQLEAGAVSVFDQGRYKSLHLPLMFIGQQSGTRGMTGMVRIILDSVDWAKGADSLTPEQSFDDAGIEFALPVDYNEATGRFGEFGVYDEAIKDFTVLPLN